MIKQEESIRVEVIKTAASLQNNSSIPASEILPLVRKATVLNLQTNSELAPYVKVGVLVC